VPPLEFSILTAYFFEGVRGLGDDFFSVAWRCASNPGFVITVVPRSGFAEFGPPAALVVSHHQLLALGVELLVANAPGIALAGELGIAPIGSLEIHLSLSEIHALLPFSAHRIVPFGII
jgi:hypothetical protein